MIETVRIHAVGGPEALRVERIPTPRPGPVEVLVRQTAIGVNYVDVYHRTGLYPLSALPTVLGVEDAVGEAARSAGDRDGRERGEG
ncbi:alcohol dehydrogenase catalytic domain-containing protein [Benzoatithermus flavus]|uniref:Alcohol dehydrogenase-like N-terminal domain-containing protein n=1 Tax=Benzoatithermus flavus TaxID=3108223 RepID=A0ABU8XUK5_9PROT